MLDNIYREDLKYRECIGLTNSGKPILAPEVIIKGLRLKGRIRVVTSQDGDSTSCDIAYKTPGPLVKNSTINGRTIMECKKVSALGYDCGYESYVK